MLKLCTVTWLYVDVLKKAMLIVLFFPLYPIDVSFLEQQQSPTITTTIYVHDQSAWGIVSRTVYMYQFNKRFLLFWLWLGKFQNRWGFLTELTSWLCRKADAWESSTIDLLLIALTSRWCKKAKWRASVFRLLTDIYWLVCSWFSQSNGTEQAVVAKCSRIVLLGFEHRERR